MRRTLLRKKPLDYYIKSNSNDDYDTDKGIWIPFIFHLTDQEEAGFNRH